jgi:hypothetical protein
MYFCSGEPMHFLSGVDRSVSPDSLAILRGEKSAGEARFAFTALLRQVLQCTANVAVGPLADTTAMSRACLLSPPKADILCGG